MLDDILLSLLELLLMPILSALMDFVEGIETWWEDAKVVWEEFK